MRNVEFRKKSFIVNKRLFLSKFSRWYVFSRKGELCKKKEPKSNLIKLSTFLKYGLTKVKKSSIEDVRLGSKYSSVNITLR